MSLEREEYEKGFAHCARCTTRRPLSKLETVTVKPKPGPTAEPAKTVRVCVETGWCSQAAKDKGLLDG